MMLTVFSFCAKFWERVHDFMNPILRTLVNLKLTSMSPKELLEFADKYDIDMTLDQATQVVHLIQTSSFNLFDDQKRRTILRTIEDEIDPELSKSMDQLFQRFIRSQSK